MISGICPSKLVIELPQNKLTVLVAELNRMWMNKDLVGKSV